MVDGKGVMIEGKSMASWGGREAGFSENRASDFNRLNLRNFPPASLTAKAVLHTFPDFTIYNYATKDPHIDT
jgi:hypothetical protein